MTRLDTLRIHAHIEEITEPFDSGQWVELKLKLEHRDDIQGECRLRVWTQNASEYHVGQEVCGVFTPVIGGDS